MAQQAQTNQAEQAEIEKLQERNAIYAKTISGMQRDVVKARARSSEAIAAKSSAAAAIAAAKKNPFAEMFKDPAMLESMRPMQLMTTKIMYGPLVKQLNLSPDQADKFYNTIVDFGLKSMQAMQSGKASPDDAKSLDSDIQSLLGEGGFAQYKDYVKNDMADQGQFASMRNDFANNPLSDTQQQQLLQAMKTARQSVTASNPLNPSDQTAMMDQGTQQQEQINQSVLQQAAAFLSPEQLQTLSTSQSNIVAIQKSMGPMMQKMFTNSPSGP